MSIATEITRLQGIKTDIRSALVEQGIESASTHDMEDFADDILAIEGGGELHGCTLVCTTEETTLIGTNAIFYKNSVQVGTARFASNNDTISCSIVVQEVGTYTVTATDGTDEATAEYTVDSNDIVNLTTKTKNASFLAIVTWANGTDNEIAKMIQAHYAGKINISDYWAVGDIRTMTLSAMETGGYVGETQPQQSVQFVIVDFNHDDKADGSGKAAITVHQKDILSTAGYVDDTQVYVGWKNSKRRSWCNSIYINALPTAIKNAVVNVTKYSTNGNGSSSITSTSDKAFLVSEIEINGSRTYSFSGEGSLYSWYQSSTNRTKGTASGYFTRSDTNNSTTGMTGRICTYQGKADHAWANSSRGIVPAFCL